MLPYQVILAWKKHMAMRSRFFWVGMKKDVIDYNRACSTCAFTKTDNKKSKLRYKREMFEPVMGGNFRRSD